jgi:hypothetical protein
MKINFHPFFAVIIIAQSRLQTEHLLILDGFFWQDYLDATESVEVPQIMFPHVEETLQNGIEIGMSLEVPIKKNNSKDDDESIYWVASIVMACGPLLRLRYFGGDDRSLEFWFNLTKEAAHELGWSVKNDKRLEPPDIVLERSPDCSEKLQEFLTTAKSIPFEMLAGVIANRKISINYHFLLLSLFIYKYYLLDFRMVLV